MLWDVLLEIGVVLLDKIGVVGLPRCRFLTLKSRQSRQVPAGGMSPLVTPSFWSSSPPPGAAANPLRAGCAFLLVVEDVKFLFGKEAFYLPKMLLGLIDLL